MTVVGPCVLLIGPTDTAVDYGDYITTITQTAPEPIVIDAINRKYSSTPKAGHTITATGVQQDLTEGKDLYKTDQGVYIQTKYCYRYAYGDEAVLSYDQYGYDNKLIFDDGDVCDVVKVFK